jgi:hypothetical protein
MPFNDDQNPPYPLPPEPTDGRPDPWARVRKNVSVGDNAFCEREAWQRQQPSKPSFLTQKRSGRR